MTQRNQQLEATGFSAHNLTRMSPSYCAIPNRAEVPQPVALLPNANPDVAHGTALEAELSGPDAASASVNETQP